MCGLTGIFSSRPLDPEQTGPVLGRMVDRLRHRGPDDRGTWLDAEAGVGLGFRRLSIIDLSERGHQPMHSPSGRYVMVFNGEAYNYREVRAELEQSRLRFRGQSDSEVLLAAIEHWGVDEAVSRFVGMFAIAVWDRERRELHLIRDRLGIKPMYVMSKSGVVLFGSELKALAAWPGFDNAVDGEALTQYLRYLYVPAPRTIYRHVFKLLPGHILTVSEADEGLPDSRPYWSAEEAARTGLAEPFAGGDEEAVSEAELLLADATRLRMRSDVPLGAFLSGGIDSSTVVALMQKASPRPVKTFSIGFDVAEHNEAAEAARVASHLGTDHTGVVLTGKDAMELIPGLPDMFDEPLADPSQLPTFLVSRLARQQVTVAVSGDGGDEVLAGYNRYVQGERLLDRLSGIPRAARLLMARGIDSLSTDSWDRLLQTTSRVLPRSYRQRLPGEKVKKVGNLLRKDSRSEMYDSLLSAWQDAEALVVPGAGDDTPVERIMERCGDMAPLDQMMLVDQAVYLPDDLLSKVDRASMAVSLEVRVPILDHRFVEFAWRLPRRFKVREGQGKWILRQILHRYVPREMVDRPKTGFTVPIGNWLKGPLRPWAEELLGGSRLEQSEFLRPAPVRSAWRTFHAGDSRLGSGLWAVLMFLAWQERWLGVTT